MKTILTFTLLLTGFTLWAAEDSLLADLADTNVTEVASAPAVTNTVAPVTAPARADTQLREQDIDEIDLEEIDDSADAAKQAMVKPTEKDVGYLDITCDEATLADILRQFRKTTQANIIFDDSSNLLKRVSANLTHVPWMDALQSLLQTKNFRLEERNGIYFVVEDRQAIPILTKSFALNHASAEELAKLFNENYGAKDAKGTVVRKVANAFSGANVVVVTAPEKTLHDCENIIKAVDKAVAQIYIEARFLELSSQALHKLGIQWNSLESWGASVKDLNAGYNFSGEKTSTTDHTWNYDYSFSGTLSADDFRLALSAFESLGEGKIFSNPKVIVSNGKEAMVDMTTKFPNVDVTSQRNTSTTTPYTDISTRIQTIPGDKGVGMFAGDVFYSWGITLSVKPRISPDGLISVVITPAISQLDSTSISQDGFYQVGQSTSDDKDTSAYSKYPIIEMKRITTEFTMKDGATAVIGGLSKTTEDDVDTGIPYLRKIPWIGQKLFGWKSREKVQKEIIVCVTIGIADPANLPRDMGLPQNAVIGREYVEGRRLEPGQRTGGADKVLELDTDDIEWQHGKRATEAEARAKEAPRGTVTITPSKEQ